MSKKTMSARLQMKELMENHPEDFQKRNFCIIYFMDELRYSVVERKNIDQNAKVMETITVKDGSKKYNATLMFIGSLDECNKRLDGLEGMAGSNPDEGPRTSSQKSKSGKKKEGSIETDLTNELKRVESLGKSLASSRKKSCDADSYHSESEDECVEMEENFALRKAPKRLSGIDLSEDDSEIGEVPFKSSRPTPATLERPSEKIEAKLDLILSRLDAIERHLSINNFKQSQETPPCVKKPKYESARRCNASDVGEISGIGSSPTSSLMHNEVNLLAIPSGGDLKKYALKVFSQLFTREEMAAGILEPSREKATGKEVLDPHRTNLLKRAITEKFGDVQMQKKWGQIRQSLNQKCLDSKRKLKSDQNVIES